MQDSTFASTLLILIIFHICNHFFLFCDSKIRNCQYNCSCLTTQKAPPYSIDSKYIAQNEFDFGKLKILMAMLLLLRILFQFQHVNAFPSLKDNSSQRSHHFLQSFLRFTPFHSFYSIQVFTDRRCIILFFNLDHNRAILIRFF